MKGVGQQQRRIEAALAHPIDIAAQRGDGVRATSPLEGHAAVDAGTIAASAASGRRAASISVAPGSGAGDPQWQGAP